MTRSTSPHGLPMALRRAQPEHFGCEGQGRGKEDNRVASCHALGLDPADPLAFLSRPWVRFVTVVVGAVTAVALIVQGVK